MMLEDAQPKLLITTQAQLARFHDIPGWNICVIANRYRSVTPLR